MNMNTKRSQRRPAARSARKRQAKDPAVQQSIPSWVTETPAEEPGLDETSYELLMMDSGGGSIDSQDIYLSRAEFEDLKGYLARKRGFVPAPETTKSAVTFALNSTREPLQAMLEDTIQQDAQDFAERAAVEDLILMHAILAAWFPSQPAEGQEDRAEPCLLPALRELLELPAEKAA